MTALLTVDGLDKRYAGIHAVRDLSYTVEAASITAVIGPNGSGKSTSIDCITGFQRPDGGRWYFSGVEMTGRPAYAQSRAGMTRSFQNVRAYGGMSLLESLLAASQAHDGVGWWSAVRRNAACRRAEVSAAERAKELLEAVGLTRYANAPTEILSYGQSKLLAIAAAMMSSPGLVILDEPVAGVNPTMVRRIEGVIRALNGQGVTFLIVEHNMPFIMALCEWVIVLENGRKIAEGAPALIRNDQRVLDAYLGGAAP